MQTFVSMASGRYRSVWRAIKIIVLVYFGVGIALYFTQDLFLFHPKSLPLEYKFPFSQPHTEQIIDRGERKLHFIKFHTDTQRKGIVLYFHGNRCNIERYAGYTNLFTANGYEVWMMDYPGFGKSTGKRTEENIYSDASLIYSLATKEAHPTSIIIYGKSIGTGVASYLAANKACLQLILETPYYSIDALAKHYFPVYPVNPMSKYSFPVNQYLKKVASPVTIIHGTKDEVIPYKQSSKLKKENANINLVSINEGRHNDLADYPQFRKEITALLQ